MVTQAFSFSIGNASSCAFGVLTTCSLNPEGNSVCPLEGQNGYKYKMPGGGSHKQLHLATWWNKPRSLTCLCTYPSSVVIPAKPQPTPSSGLGDLASLAAFWPLGLHDQPGIWDKWWSKSTWSGLGWPLWKGWRHSVPKINVFPCCVRRSLIHRLEGSKILAERHKSF